MSQARRPRGNSGRLSGCEVLKRGGSSLTRLNPRRYTKRRELHKLVHHPAQCKKLSKVEQANIDWEKNRDDYYACGGQAVEDPEQCTIILDLLPADTPSTLMMASEEYEGNFEEMKKKIDRQITFLTDHAKSHSGRIHIADERMPSGSSRATASLVGDDDDLEEPDQAPPADAVDLTSFPEPVQDSILATDANAPHDAPDKMQKQWTWLVGWCC